MKKLDMELVVVEIDGSPAAAEALEWAVAEAHLTGARVEAVYAGIQARSLRLAHRGPTGVRSGKPPSSTRSSLCAV